MSLAFEYTNDAADLDRFTAAESPEPVFIAAFPEEAFLREYDVAYDSIFAALLPFGCKESGRSGPGTLSMSRHVDATRHITVVVLRAPTDLGRILVGVHAALQTLPEVYSVRLDDYPTCVCVSHRGRVLGFDADGRYDRLLAYGFPPQTA